MGTRKLASLAAALGLIAVSPVWAGSITFDFNACAAITSSHVGCPDDLGTSTATFTDTTGAYQVQVSGMDRSLQPLDLAVVANGYGQSGLGIAPGTDDEVDYGEVLSLDLGGLSRLGAFGGMATIDDLMGGEIAVACALPSQAGSGSCPTFEGTGYPGIAQNAVTWSPGDQSLDFFVPIAGAGNFLLGSLTVYANPVPQTDAVPEPGSAPLFALGLSGLILVVARRRRIAAD